MVGERAEREGSLTSCQGRRGGVAGTWEGMKASEVEWNGVVGGG